MKCPDCNEKIGPSTSATWCPYCGKIFPMTPGSSVIAPPPVGRKLALPLLILLFSPAILSMLLVIFHSPLLSIFCIFTGSPIAGSIAGIILSRKTAKNTVERIVLAVVIAVGLTIACLISCFPSCALVEGRHITGG